MNLSVSDKPLTLPNHAGRDNLRSRLARFAAPLNRQLLAALIRTGLRANDHNLLLGFGWSLASPLIMLGILYLLFRDRFGQNIAAYPAYLLLGLVTVNFFTALTRQIMPVFVTSKEMFVNTTILRETVIASYTVLAWYRFAIELVFCLGVTWYLGVFLGWSVLLALPLLLAFTGFSLGVSLLLAILYVHIRDIEHAWALVTRLLWFVTPIFFGLDAFTGWSAHAIFWLNPLTPFVIALRGVIMGDPAFQPWVYGYALFLGSMTFLLGYGVFFKHQARAMERA
jgi:ABC-type polysaccharide/polyol phosphate export permease